MKQIERSIQTLVVVLLVVFIAAGCDSASPLGPDIEEPPEPKPQPDSSYVKVEVQDFNSGERIANTSIFEIIREDSIEQEQESPGLYTDKRKQADKEISFYATAEGYQNSSVQRGNLQSDVKITIRLKQEKADPEGPGKVELVDKTCSNGDDGIIIVKSANGGTVKLKDSDGNVVDSKSVGAGEKAKFSGLSPDSFTAIFEKNDITEPLEINLEACETENKPGPGTITVKSTSCSDEGEDTGVITVRIENGASLTKIVDEDGDLVNDLKHTRENPKANQEETFDGVPAGDWTVIAELNGKTTHKDVSVDVCKTEPKNKAPKADFATDRDGSNPLKIHFADKSNDSDGEIVKYRWKFGDGSTSDKENPTHTYATEGSYDVKLTVTDDDGTSDSVTKTVHPKEPESSQLGHEVNFDTGEDFSFINGDSRRYDELLRFGEVRPILGDTEPVGEVTIEAFFSSNAESRQEFRLRFCTDEGGNDCFVTDSFIVPGNEPGRTSSTVKVPADRFNVNQKMSIEAIHGDEYRDDLPDGPDSIHFSTSGIGNDKVVGKLRFLWRTEAD